jgi:DNA adenine methylase
MRRVSSSPSPALARPPLKIQGGKSRLIPFLRENLDYDPVAQRWVEPFLGSGAVLLNAMPQRAVVGDTNPHTIVLYSALQAGCVEVQEIAEHLTRESEQLRGDGEAHYYVVRQRFNHDPSPLDFVFLDHTCFNGLLRFNRRGEFNSPFCRNPERLTPSLIADIAGRLNYFQAASQENDWQFLLQDWRLTLAAVTEADFVYADPPYAGRHTTYHGGWAEQDAADLASTLKALPCPWALSDWAADAGGVNPRIEQLYPGHTVRANAYRYVVGARASSRGRVTEALVLSPRSQHELGRSPRGGSRDSELSAESGLCQL